VRLDAETDHELAARVDGAVAELGAGTDWIARSTKRTALLAASPASFQPSNANSSEASRSAGVTCMISDSFTTPGWHAGPPRHK
jgi:hypothetical protein